MGSSICRIFMYVWSYTGSAELGKVTMERGKVGGISSFLAAHGTYFYTAHTNQGDYTAYCLEPDKNFVPPGEYELNSTG